MHKYLATLRLLASLPSSSAGLSQLLCPTEGECVEQDKETVEKCDEPVCHGLSGYHDFACKFSVHVHVDHVKIAAFPWEHRR